MVYCTTCATEIKENWNACPNCGKAVNENSSQVNTSYPQNIVKDYSSVDKCLEEIKSISNYRTVNSKNKKKAFQISLLLNTIYLLYKYIEWTIIDVWRYADELTLEYFLSFREFKDFFWTESEIYYIIFGQYYDSNWSWLEYSPHSDTWIIWTIILYFVISIILGVRSKSIFKGSLLRGNSLINSMEILLNQYPNYPRRGEFIIVKSEFEAATKFRSLIAIIIGILGFLFIILTIWGNKDNKKY